MQGWKEGWRSNVSFWDEANHTRDIMRYASVNMVLGIIFKCAKEIRILRQS